MSILTPTGAHSAGAGRPDDERPSSDAPHVSGTRRVSQSRVAPVAEAPAEPKLGPRVEAHAGTEREVPLEFPERTDLAHNVALALFIVVPLLAVLAAVPVAWGWGLSWRDVVLGLVFYVVSGLGITVGFHRYFTHGGYKAKRWLRIALGVAGSLAIENGVITWVADHRKHHKFSDAEGDPHSPWRFGTSVGALTKGLWWAHMGWLFDVEKTNKRTYAPDLLKDPDMVRLERAFPGLVAVSMLLPAVLGGLLSWSWTGALTAFFWASLVRVGLLHHVTWSINSICHVIGERRFASRDASRNVWWLAIPSFGESWHNLHHTDPTCARHGVDPGQIDISAGVIRLFEKAGWAWNVRWPRMDKLAAKRVHAD